MMKNSDGKIKNITVSIQSDLTDIFPYRAATRCYFCPKFRPTVLLKICKKVYVIFITVTRIAITSQTVTDCFIHSFTLGRT